MYVQINDIDRNIYMVASVVKNGKEITYKMINGVQLKEVFDSEPEAEAKYENVIAMSGGGSNIPLDPDGKIPAEYLPSYVDDVEDLLAVTDTAPSTCAKGDKYYNTVDKKIFTATSANTWDSTGKTPEKDKIYVNTADDPASSWRWSGTDLVMIGGGEIDLSSVKSMGYTSQYDTTTNYLVLDDYEPGDYLILVDELKQICLKVTKESNTYYPQEYFTNDIGGNACYIKYIKNLNDAALDEVFLEIYHLMAMDSAGNMFGNKSSFYLSSSGGVQRASSSLGGATVGFITSNAQTWSGIKTFSSLPESSGTPTTNNQLVNKKYVDDNMGNIQYSTMPTASVDFLDEIIQYTGTTSNGYTKGYFYVCESDGGNPATYSWTQINVQPQGSSPSPDLPENGTRLLRKAANSVQALGQISDPQVQDACLVLTDEVIEHVNNVPIDFMQGLTAGETIKFNKKQSFTFTGDVSILNTVPDINLAVVVDDSTEFGRAKEWLGFNIAGPNPLDNKSWYAFEFIAGPDSPAAELRQYTGIINAWVCEDPETDPTFRYIEDGTLVASLVDGFGYDVYEYGLEEYTPVNDLFDTLDDISIKTQGQVDYTAFIDLPFSKDIVTTETYKKSDLYVYDGSEWVYTDRNLSANANWDENDPTAPGYVRGRTHYTIPGTGETKLTLDCSDTTIYSVEHGDQPIGPSGILQVDVFTQDDVLDNENITAFYNKLKELYEEGYSDASKTFVFEYGSRRTNVYVLKDEQSDDNGYSWEAYSLWGADESEDAYYDGTSTFGIQVFLSRDYQDNEFIGYYVGINIYSDIFEEESDCVLFSIVQGSTDVVVKLDPKYIPQMADWNENNENSPRYIANRTHYKIGSKFEDTLVEENFNNLSLGENATSESVSYLEGVEIYSVKISDPTETEGNVEAKEIYEALESIYDRYGNNTEVTIKVGNYKASGKLLRSIILKSDNTNEIVYCVATDGGELAADDNEHYSGTTNDKFDEDSANSKGILLYVRMYEYHPMD